MYLKQPEHLYKGVLSNLYFIRCKEKNRFTMGNYLKKQIFAFIMFKSERNDKFLFRTIVKHISFFS